MWHPIAAALELEPDARYESLLLGHGLCYGQSSSGELWATGDTTTGETALPVIERFGYLWTSLGEPDGDLFAIAEAGESDRRALNAASIKVATSAPRAVENFLDMGHFPYVHSGYLGIEPETEVRDYDVAIEHGEVWARNCHFFQPLAAASAEDGQMSEYTYRVPHPYCVMLYKNVPADPTRCDVIALFVQAMTETTLRAHNFLCVVDEASTDTELKRFQQVIFSQDKPILENQLPARLPLAPGAETPIRADKSSSIYRRWLHDLGITYGVIPR